VLQSAAARFMSLVGACATADSLCQKHTRHVRSGQMDVFQHHRRAQKSLQGGTRTLEAGIRKESSLSKRWDCFSAGASLPWAGQSGILSQWPCGAVSTNAWALVHTARRRSA